MPLARVVLLALSALGPDSTTTGDRPEPAIAAGSFWPAGPVAIFSVVPEEGPSSNAARLPANAPGIAWAEGSRCRAASHELLAWVDGAWVAEPFERELEPDVAGLIWLRPAQGWRVGRAYRVSTRCWPRSLNAMEVPPVLWNEVQIEAARPGPLARPRRISPVHDPQACAVEERQPDPSQAPGWAKGWIGLCLGVLALGLAQITARD